MSSVKHVIAASLTCRRAMGERAVALLQPLSRLPSFEIGGPHFGARQQHGSGSAQYDLPCLHDIASVGETQRMVRVLLNQQYSHFPPIVNFADGIEDLF